MTVMTLRWKVSAAKRIPWCCCHFKAWPINAISRDGGTTETSEATAEIGTTKEQEKLMVIT
jgi:hypothetical protein